MHHYKNMLLKLEKFESRTRNNSNEGRLAHSCSRRIAILRYDSGSGSRPRHIMHQSSYHIQTSPGWDFAIFIIVSHFSEKPSNLDAFVDIMWPTYAKNFCLAPWRCLHWLWKWEQGFLSCIFLESVDYNISFS